MVHETRAYRGASDGLLSPTRWFKRTGSWRAPKKNEYYLSGAIPEAHQALSNLKNSFYILEEVFPPDYVDVGSFRYKLIGAKGDN